MANTEKQKRFDQAIAGINKHIKTENGDSLIAKLSDKPRDVQRISSGSIVLDSLLGGGFPVGRVIEIYGPEGSGKTSIALNAAGYVQKHGGTVAFVDFENALDPVYAARLGVDVANLAVAQPDSAEQGLDLVEQLTEAGVVDLIVVDSIAAMVPRTEIEGSAGDQQPGVQARLMSRALRKLIGFANRTHTTIIFTNQLREKIGVMFGNPETTPGGKAMKFSASQRIDIRKREQIKDGNETIGTKVKLKIVKNKVAAPFAVGETVLTFLKGINRAAELIEVGPDYGVIAKPNNRSYVDAATGEVISSKSKADAIKTLEENEDLSNSVASHLQQKIADKLAGVESPTPGTADNNADSVDIDDNDGNADTDVEG